MDRMLYSIEQARDALGGVSRDVVFNLLREGRLERVKLGARTLVPAASLRALVASLPVPAGEGAGK